MPSQRHRLPWGAERCSEEDMGSRRLDTPPHINTKNIDDKHFERISTETYVFVSAKLK